MKCDRHMWDTLDREWCWRCEELTLEENKKKYEDKLRDNGLQRIGGDKEIGSIYFGTQETSG
ncbi:MAG: hypothetical protein RLZ10_1376 [Bacteroidota bacterium]